MAGSSGREWDSNAKLIIPFVGHNGVGEFKLTADRRRLTADAGFVTMG